MKTCEQAPADEIRVGRDRIRFKVTSEQSGGEVAVFEVRMPPGGGPPILHRHEPFELYRVLSGELAIYLEGKDAARRADGAIRPCRRRARRRGGGGRPPSW